MNATPPPTSVLIRFLGPVAQRLRLVHILLLAGLLLVPSLNNTFYGDDFHHYAQLNGKAESLQVNDLSLFGLFSFVGDNPERRQKLKELSILPWWTGEQFSWRFWRPVTELTLYLDYAWLQHQPLMHLHSILWYLAVTGLLFCLFRQLFTQQSTALLATALFALNGSHGLLVGWLCSRSPLLACFFAVLTLLAHHRAVTKNSHLFLVLSFVTSLLSLLSAEMGISTTAWLFAYALFIDQRRLSTRILSLLPFAIIVVIWWSIYQMAGFGVSANNDFYIEPMDQPVLFLHNLIVAIPTLVFSQWLSIPSDLLARGIASPISIAGGLAGLAILFLVYRHTQRSRVLLFFVCGGLLSIFPLASTPLQDRNVIFVSIGFAGILAITLEALWLHLQQSGRIATSSVMTLLILLHFAFSPLVLFFMSQAPTFLAEPGMRRAATLDYQQGDRLIIIGAPAIEVAYLAPTLLYLNNTMPASIWNIAGKQRDFHLDIAGENTLHLTSDNGLLDKSEQFVRSLASEPFSAGDKIDLDGLEIIVKGSNTGGHPTEVVFQTAQPLDSYAIYRWQRKGFKRLSGKDFPLQKE